MLDFISGNVHKLRQKITDAFTLNAWGAGLLMLFFLFSTTRAEAQETSQNARGNRAANPIKGRITTEDGDALPGVSIMLKGSARGAFTDSSGAFSIDVPGPESILVFTYTGYLPEEVKVGSRKVINVRMTPLAIDLEKVVVVGYGTVKKKDLTGAVGEVNVKELSKAPVASFDQALAGRIAGVQVSSSEDGQPGSGMNLVIRGANSLTQDNSPLYVIDGMPIENPETAGINPSDIASINVLKDASATAIYGSRAANGVIVIETKKGLEGKPVISFETSIGIENVAKKIEMLSPYEFVKYEVERYGQSSAQLQYFEGGKTLDSYKEINGIDWQDQLFKTGSTKIYNLALRGGNKQTKYSISGSAFNQDAIVINTGYRKYQGRVSLDQTVNRKLKVGVDAAFTNQFASGQILGRTSATSETTISGYLLYSTWGYRPVTGKASGDGDLLDDILDEDLDESADFRINPIVSAKNTLRERRTNHISANGYANYSITKNLMLRVTGGLIGSTVRNNSFYNSKTVRGTPLRPNNINGVNGSISNSSRNIWVNENTLTYNKAINRNHRINILGGMTLQGESRGADGFSAIQVPNEELGIHGLSQGIPLETTSEATNNRLQSFFGRVNYNYKSKILTTLTMRADGSSKFAPQNRWGYFPSGAVAWRFSEEKLFKKVKMLSDGKLRLSYGLTGNNRVSDFAYLASLSQSDLASYSFNNTRYFGINLGTLTNNDLKWETTEQMDVGLDISLFKSRVNFIADWYRKTTSDLLLFADLPFTTGYSRAYKNVGTIRNEGFEFTLQTVNVHSKSFTWSSDFNISFNRNKILALNDHQPNMLSTIGSFISRISAEPIYIAEVGKPAAMFYGLIWDGVYQYSDFTETTPGVYVLKNSVPTNGDLRSVIQPGDIKYKDINKDGVIDADDKTVIGNGLPKHIGGFSNMFSYKNIDLSVFLQWSYGNDLMNANRMVFEGNITNVPHFNQYATWANRWTPDNPSNTLFRTGGAGPQVISSRTLEDGSYLRLKTVSLAYNISSKILSRIKMDALSLNVSAQNLLTWTNYSGLDPEVSVRNSVLTPGFDFSAYPHARTIVFGIKARF